MNRKATLLLSLIVLATMFLFAMSVGTWRDLEILSQAEIQFEKKTAAYLKQMSESFRNELLQDNIRVVRNMLSALRDESLFSEFAIQRENEIIDESQNYKNFATDPKYFKTTIPVYFVVGSERRWGNVHYLTAKEELRKSATVLRPMLLLNSMLIAGFAVGVVWLVIVIFWRSGESLVKFVDSSLADTVVHPEKNLNFLWSPLLTRLSDIIEKNKEASKKIEKFAVQKELALLAAQVAHDIRSPLTALKISANVAKRTPESDNLMNSSIKRIEEIAQDLLDAWKPVRESFMVDQNIRTHRPPTTTGLFDLSIALQELIEETKVRLNGRLKVEFDGPQGDLPLSGNRCEFQRVISNLINNSIDALNDHTNGEVKIYLRKYSTKADISIIDNGSGISPDIIAEIGSIGVSSGKGNLGNGLGLAHAKNFVESSGGSLRIASNLNVGTNVTLSFPMPNS